jgi:Kef-type K+ transport system membrane component KefB
MKELFGLKSFQQILSGLFLLGIIIGATVASTIANSDNFKLTNFVLLFMVPLFFISRGIYKNVHLFIRDAKNFETSNP